MSAKNQELQSATTKVLIVYYSYSGNTGKVAHEIHRIAGGDLQRREY